MTSARGSVKVEYRKVIDQSKEVAPGGRYVVDESQKVVAERREVVISASLYIMRPLLDAPKTGAV